MFFCIVVVSADALQAEKPTAGKERGAVGGSTRVVGTSFHGVLNQGCQG